MKKRKKFIALIVIFILVSAVSVMALVWAISATVGMIKSYPYPIDSFWSFDLAAVIIIISSVLLIFSIVGVVFSIKKLISKP